MTSDHAQILKNKICSAHFELAAYPKLSALVHALGKSCAFLLTQRIGEPMVQLAGYNAVATDCRTVIAAAESAANVVFLADLKDGRPLLIEIDAGFTSAFSEHALGGPFDFPERPDGVSAIDQELLAAALSEFAPAFAECGLGISLARMSGAEGPVRAVLAPAQEAKGFGDASVCGVSLALLLAETSHEFKVTFYLPMDHLEEVGLLDKDLPVAADPRDDSRWGRELENGLKTDRIDLDVILDRLKINLSALASFSVGDVVALTANPENQVEIVLDTSKGPRLVGTGRLGVSNKNKAVKITSVGAAEKPAT